MTRLKLVHRDSDHSISLWVGLLVGRAAGLPGDQTSLMDLIIKNKPHEKTAESGHKFH